MLVSIVLIAFQWTPAGNNPTIFLLLFFRLSSWFLSTCRTADSRKQFHMMYNYDDMYDFMFLHSVHVCIWHDPLKMLQICIKPIHQFFPPVLWLFVLCGGWSGGGGVIGGGGYFFSKIEDIHLYRFSCWGGGVVGRGGGLGFFCFFSKIEDIHLYRFSCWGGGGGRGGWWSGEGGYLKKKSKTFICIDFHVYLLIFSPIMEALLQKDM